MSRRLRFAAESAILKLARLAARAAPRGWLHAAGRALGRLAYRLARPRRRITLDNLAKVWPERSPTERQRIARGCFEILGRNAFDLLAFQRYGPDSIGGSVRLEGWEHLQRAHARGRGVLVISGHYGHWELTALMQGYLGIPMRLLYRPLDNVALDRQLLQMRQLSGNGVLSKRDGVRGMLQALRAGEVVAFVLDQDAGSDGVMLPFFGHAASTTTTPARLALRLGAAVVPTFCVAEPGGRYRIVYEPELTLEPGPDREEDILEMTRRLNRVLERWIEQHPEQWFWMHRRWKTQRTRSSTP